jgi:hypothetical protein
MAESKQAQEATGGLAERSLLAVFLAGGLGLAWIAAEVATPRSSLVPMVFQFLAFLVITLATTLSGYLLVRRIAGLDLLERLVLGFAVALALVLMATLALGLAGLIKGVALGVLLVLLVTGLVGAVTLRRDWRSERGTPQSASPTNALAGADWFLIGLAAVLAALVLYVAWGFCIEYDVLEYHAGVPAAWLQADRIVALPHNIYSYFPMAAEMLYLFAMSLVGEAATGAALGKLLVGSCTVWTALAILCAGRRLFSLRAGLVAAALYLTVPTVFRVSADGLVEGVQSFYTVAALLAAVILFVRRGVEAGGGPDQPLSPRERVALQGRVRAPLAATETAPSPPPEGGTSPKGGGVTATARTGTSPVPTKATANSNSADRDKPCPYDSKNSKAALGLAIVLGVVAGMTASIKMTNLAFVLPPVGLAVVIACFRRRLGWGAFCGFAAAALLFAAPFYVRNFALTGNPFFPVWSTLLGGPAGWTSDLAARFAQFHSPGAFTFAALRNALVGSPESAPEDTAWFLYSGAVLLLVPLALFDRAARRRVLLLLAIVAFTVAAWFCFSHRVERLLLPLWALLALIAGVGLRAFADRRARAVLVAAALALAVLDGVLNLKVVEERAVHLDLVADSLQAQPTGGYYPFRYNVNTTDTLWTYSPYAVRMVNDTAAKSQPVAKVGLVGEAETLYFTVPLVYNTVFNRPWLAAPDDGPSPVARQERLEAAKDQIRRLGVKLIYVNWAEVERFKRPGNYGWPAWLNREFFDELEKDKTLKQLWKMGGAPQSPQYVLYLVTRA